LEGPINSFDQGDLEATIPPYQNLPCHPPKKQNPGMRFRESGTWMIFPLTTAVGSSLPVQTKRNAPGPRPAYRPTSRRQHGGRRR